MPRSTPDLRIPGPTPLHPEVAAAVGRPMTSYRGPEMRALLPKLLRELSDFVGSRAEPILLTASGTGAMEAALVNTLSPGDRVLGLGGGVFADRFLRIAAAFGLDVASLDTPWGEPADPRRLTDALRGRPDTRAVLLTHCETSTGVLHPLAEMIAAARGAGKPLVLVDAVSSLGAVEVPIADSDIVFTGSQKAWGLPPGMAMVWTSPRAEAAEREARLPRFYWGFDRYREAAARGSFPSTPALPVLFAMEAGLRLLREEGRDAVFARHAACAAHARDGLRDLGLRLVAPDSQASPTVTAAWLPDGISWPDLAGRLREEHRLVLGGGLGRLAGRVLRLGHLGWATPKDIDRAVSAVGRALADT